MTSPAAFVKSVEETVAIQPAGLRARLSVTVTAPKLPTEPITEPTLCDTPEPRSTVAVGAVMASTPVVVSVNVTGVFAVGLPTVRAIVSARTDVTAPAGKAD